MPVTPTYPGVYIEEIPSGVRTIIGVATSITAFIGRALRGPINEPTTINNFSDFERQFGGLHVDYPMSYALRDFYLNGGNQAIILRLFKSQEEGKDGRAKYNTGNLYLEAANPGIWGNNLSIKIDYDDIDEDFAASYGLQTTDLFNLTIVENPPRGTIERINNVSLKQNAGSRRVDRVLKQQSQRVRIQTIGDVPTGIAPDANRPPENPDDRDPTNPNTQPSNIDKFAEGTDSANLTPEDYEVQKDQNEQIIPKTGLKALDKADLFNLLCIPPEIRTEDTAPEIYQLALPYCVERRAILIVDPPKKWGGKPRASSKYSKRRYQK